MTFPESHDHNETEHQTVTSVVMPSDEFLQILVAELDNDNIIGIALGGSYAQGNATPYSNLDLVCFYKDEASLLPYQFFYRNDLLISVDTKTVAGIRADLTKPEKAVFLAATQYHILLDKDGSVTELLKEIATFPWEPLQQKAFEYASFQMMRTAELVHKILSEIFRRNNLAIAYTTAKLLSSLTEIVTVQGAIPIINDNVYYQQVEVAVGLETAWTCYHRLVAGVDTLPANTAPITVRAVAALHLYQETIKLLKPTMQPEHMAIAEQAMRVFREAGPHLQL